MAMTAKPVELNPAPLLAEPELAPGADGDDEGACSPGTLAAIAAAALEAALTLPVVGCSHGRMGCEAAAESAPAACCALEKGDVLCPVIPAVIAAMSETASRATVPALL